MTLKSIIVRLLRFIEIILGIFQFEFRVFELVPTWFVGRLYETFDTVLTSTLVRVTEKTRPEARIFRNVELALKGEYM